MKRQKRKIKNGRHYSSKSGHEDGPCCSRESSSKYSHSKRSLSRSKSPDPSKRGKSSKSEMYKDKLPMAYRPDRDELNDDSDNSTESKSSLSKISISSKNSDDDFESGQASTDESEK